MDINRSNYGIWLTDLLDGTLNEHQVAVLMAFLDANPDLKDEYEGLTLMQTYSHSGKFPFKERLKKSTSELSDSQFELLCAAHLEKDLDQQQEAELREIITGSPERKIEFQLFQKTVLLQPKYEFPGKKSLKKGLVNYSAPLYISLLSAAAVVALIIYSDILFKGNTPEKGVRLAQNVTVDTFEIKAGTAVQQNFVPTGNSIAEQHSPGNGKTMTKENTADLTKDRTLNNDRPIEKIEFKDLKIKSEFYSIPDDLIANNQPGIPRNPVKERSKIGSFLAREYREIILNDKKATDKPIDGLEIAEGGIKGLNKLLGWEMALQKNSDENGNLKSVHFDSRFIKISAPAKKAKPQL